MKEEGPVHLLGSERYYGLPPSKRWQPVENPTLA